MWFIYLADTLSKIAGFACIISFSSVLGSLAICFWRVCFNDLENKTPDLLLKKIKPVILFSIIILFIALLVPSKQTMYLMASAKFVREIEGSEKLPENTVKALNKLLEAYIKPEKETGE
jgi:amino acid transporter